MKILKLKYKMHKLVNCIFYIGIFIFGFLLGFSAEKINFNKLISQVLFIDSASAETVEECRDSYNLFNVTNYENIVYTLKNNPTISLTTDSIIIVRNVTQIEGIKLLPSDVAKYVDNFDRTLEYTISFDITVNNDITFQYGAVTQEKVDLSVGTTRLSVKTNIGSSFLVFQIWTGSVGTNVTISNIMFIDGEYTEYEEYGKQVCSPEEPTVPDIELVEDSFYDFSKKIIGELEEKDYWVYDFTTAFLISACFTLFILVIGYIINKIFGG